jgi:hypothetical protein
MPQLLRDILAQVIQGYDGCIVLKGKKALQSPSGQTISPDVVILGLTAAEDAMLVPALLARWPDAHVMTLMLADEDVAAYALTPECRALGRLSPSEIVDSLCEAIARKRDCVDELVED